jgi:hypothetical protein
MRFDMDQIHPHLANIERFTAVYTKSQRLWLDLFDRSFSLIQFHFSLFTEETKTALGQVRSNDIA